MSRTLLEEGNRRCPVCGEHKERLSRHWSYCEWPAVDENLHALLDGILLGGGSIQGNGDAKHLVVKTIHRPLAEWLLETFGRIAHSLRRRTYDGDREPLYLVRTHAHQALSRYRDRWYADGQKQLRDDVSLTPLGGQIWWGLAGGIEWSGPYDSQRKLVFSAEADGRADAIQTVLDTVGFDSDRVDRRVAMFGATASDWLDWIGDPLPGVEYKWVDSQILYRALRTAPPTEIDFETALASQALEVARERTGLELTPAVFDERVDEIDASRVASLLGGGSWSDALRTAGVQQAPTDTSPTQPGESPSMPSQTDRSPKYSPEDIQQAIQKAAADLGEPLGLDEYDKWQKNTDGVPSATTIASTGVGQYDGWVAACDAAGVEPAGTPYGREYKMDDMIDAVARVLSILDEVPGVYDYAELRQPSDPGHAWFYLNRGDEINSWGDLIEAAKQRQ